MTNLKKDQNKEKPENLPATTTKSPSLLEQSEKLRETESDKESKAHRVKVETPKQTADIKREILEEEVAGPDEETTKSILALDPDKEIMPQVENYKRLAIVGTTLFPKLFAKKVPKEDLSDLSKISTIKLPEDIQLNGSEIMAWKKLQEISSKPDSKAFKFLSKTPDFFTYKLLAAYLKDSDKEIPLWTTLINSSYKSYQNAAEAKAILTGDETPAAKPEHEAPPKSPGLKGTLSEKANTLVDTVKKHPLATALIMAAGAYGIYRIFFKEESAIPDSELASGGKKTEKKETFWEKIGLTSKKKKWAAIIIGLLVLGGLIGKGDIGSFLAKITKQPLEKIQEVLALVTGGKLKEAWDAITKGKDAAVEVAKKGYEWLDKQLNFTTLYKEFEGFFKQHNIEMPVALKGLSFSSIAKELGLDPENESTWKEFMVGGGVMGAALLLYKYTKLKSIPISAGLYVFLLRKGPESLGGQLLGVLTESVDKTKTAILDKLKKSLGNNSILAEYILDEAFYDFKLKDSTDHILKWASEHPLESLAAINGLWICRSLIYKTIVGGGLLAGKGAIYAVKNPANAALFAAGGALAGGLIWTDRKKIVESVISAVYDDPNGKDAIAMKKSIDETLKIDRSTPDTLVEKQSRTFRQSIIENPLKRLADIEVIEAFKKGDLILGVNSAFQVFLFMGEMTAPVILTKLTWESFQTTLSHIYSPDSKGNVMKSVAIGGVQVFVFGSMAIEGIRSYKTIIDSGEGVSDTFWRALKTLNPASQEGKYVIKSALTGVPGVKATLRTLQHFKIKRAQDKLQEILTLARQSNPDFGKIRKLSDDLETMRIFQDFSKIKDKLTGFHFNYRVAKRLEDINRRINNINQAAALGKTNEIIKLTQDAHANLEVVRKDTGQFLKRLRLIANGEFREALNMPDAAEDIKHATEDAERAKAMRPMTDTDRIFKNADGTIKSQTDLETTARKLSDEIKKLGKDDPARIAKIKELEAIRTFIDPTRATQFSTNAENIAKAPDALKAQRIETVARRLEAVEAGLQAKFTTEVEKIVSEAKLSGTPLTHPSVTAKLEKLDQDLLIPFAQQKQSTIKLLTSEYKNLPSGLRTQTLRTQIKNAIEGAEGSTLTKIAKGAKGRLKMMVLMGTLIFATDQLIHKDSAEREMAQIFAELGPELGQLLLDVLPIAGTFSNFYSAFSGREIVTERDVSGTWDRASNVCWGTVGLAGDIITVLTAIPSASGSVWGNVAVRLAKATAAGSKTAPKLLKMLPRIQKIAERSGGIYKFAEKLTKFIKADGSVLKTLRAVQTVGMVGGTALLAGGAAYHLRYAFVDRDTELDVPAEILDTSATPSAISPDNSTPLKPAPTESSDSKAAA